VVSVFRGYTPTDDVATDWVVIKTRDASGLGRPIRQGRWTSMASFASIRTPLLR
jgi:hypothetical protein